MIFADDSDDSDDFLGKLGQWCGRRRSLSRGMWGEMTPRWEQSLGGQPWPSSPKILQTPIYKTICSQQRQISGKEHFYS